jgi:hypothetical protein
MSDEPPGAPNGAAISKLFDSEEERAISLLHKQLRVLRATSLRPLKIELPAIGGALGLPRYTFLLDDGRVLEWFGESRPYVVHPCYGDLCRMHGLQASLVHAA